MVAEDSPESLPHGWTLRFNVLKTGRKVKHYVNSGTGQKFFSRDDLMNYIKAQNSQFGRPQLTKSHIGRSLKNNQMHLIEYTNEHPKWLPHGWIMALKTRNSGSSKGKSYKCYVDTSTGHKCYSKPEVFRFLKTVKQKSSASKQKEMLTTTVRTKVTIEKPAAEDLHPGWIKETRIARWENGTTKDPPLPAAKRQKSKHPVTRSQLLGGNGSADVSSMASSGAYSLWTKGGKTAVCSLATLPVATSIEISSQKSAMDDGTKSKENSNVNWYRPTEAEDSGRNQDKMVSADGRPEILFHEADDRQGQNSLLNGVKSNENYSKKTWNNLSKCNHKNGVDLPRRFSKRLAGIESDALVSSMSTMQLSSGAFKKQGQNTGNGIKGFGSYKIETHSFSEPNNKGLKMRHQFSKRLAGLEPEPEPVPNSDVHAPSKIIRSAKGEADLTAGFNNSTAAGETSEQTQFEPRKELLLHTSCDANNLLHGVKPEPVANSVFIVQALPKTIRGAKGETALADIKQEQNNPASWKKLKSQTKNENNLRTSSRKKWLNWPRRSSKRLAGLGAEQVANSVSGAQALQTSEISSKNESVLPVGLTPSGLAGETSKHIRADHNNPSHGKLSNKNQMLRHADAGSEEKSQILEVGKTNDKKLESDSVRLFGEFLSDPCLLFAFKTLTGELPVEIASDNVLVSTPVPDVIDEGNLTMRKIDKCSYGKAEMSSRKLKTRKKLSLFHKASELQPGPVASLFTKNSAFKNAGRMSSETGAALDMDSALNNFAVAPEADCAHHHFANAKTMPQYEPSNNRIWHLDNHTATEEHSQTLEVKNYDKPEQPAFSSFGNYWPDPSFEFAFKTLTGAIPVEDSLQVQSYFQQQVNASRTRQKFDISQTPRDVGSSLPDCGLSSFFQTDISVHLDPPEKQPASQLQKPVNNHSFLPSGTVSSVSRSSISSQQQQNVKENKGLRRKVNS